MSLYYSHNHLSTWGKAKPLLCHNLWASCTTSPTLLLPLWTYPCLSLLPPLSTSCLLLDLNKCAPAADTLHMEPSQPGRLFLQWLHDLFPHPQVSSGKAQHRFPQLLSSNIKAVCPSPPPTGICLLPLLHLRPECLFLGVTVFHSLLGAKELQESESCAVCCCMPRTRSRPSIW